MTREEAINYLNECSEAIGDTEHHTLSYAKEALNMAIKALSQQTEDTISRQAVLEIAKSSKSNWIDNSVLFKRVNELPSVNPQEPKTGHWIDDGFYAEGHSHKAFHCSKCGHNVLGFKEDLSNYCPNCGCRMVEPQESEE